MANAEFIGVYMINECELIHKLNGKNLDLAVTRAQGRTCYTTSIRDEVCHILCGVLNKTHEWYSFTPSCNWIDGGRIIELECISIVYEGENLWNASIPIDDEIEYVIAGGETPLIAAMRAFVRRAVFKGQLNLSEFV